MQTVKEAFQLLHRELSQELMSANIPDSETAATKIENALLAAMQKTVNQLDD